MSIQDLLIRNHRSENRTVHDRRRFLKAGLNACALFTLPLVTSPIHAVMQQPLEKKLAFLNLHTGERIRSVYWADGQYIPEALHAICTVLRDHRTGEQSAIDTDLFDILHLLQSRLESEQEFHVISAYRSPASNDMLSARSHGVAKTSLHIFGKAIDIRLPGIRLSHLHNAALSLQMGGVGYYPSSDFIHLDVGRVRSWSG